MCLIRNLEGSDCLIK